MPIFLSSHKILVLLQYTNNQTKIRIIMEEKVLAALAQGGEMKSGEVAAATGIDKKEVDKVIKKLVAEGKVVSPKRCFYATK